MFSKNVLRALALALTGAASTALAFGPQGHAASGRLADRLIEGTVAKAHVDATLWPGERLEDAANWLDCVRGVTAAPEFRYEPTYKERACRLYEQSPALVEEMRAYARNNHGNCDYNGARAQCHKAFHFTNVPLQAGRYLPRSVGAGEADVVHAVQAAVLFLRDGTVAQPFRFSEGQAGRREALRLLAHLVGDIHQPLHVGSVYLTPKGRAVNPNKGVYDPATHTAGGNLLMLSADRNLHARWDGIDAPIMSEDLTGEAAIVGESPGAPETWAAQWASETILQARAAFRGLRIGHKVHGTWPVKVRDLVAYERDRAEIQRLQVIRAGARLAEILQAVWPDGWR